MGEVFGQRRTAPPLIIGSVKTNIGHLEAAAGIASLIKVVMALQQQEIPPHLHLQQPNPHIDWEQLPIKVATRTPWTRGQQQRIAGVSSFGFSGTNAHVVVAEAPQVEKKLAELAALETALAGRELDLATNLAELHAFEREYLRVVGSR